MNTYLECIPCFFRQALFAARAVTENETKIKQVLNRIAGLVPGIPLSSPPPETARLIYRAVREVTGVADPFRAYKDKSIEKALSIYGECLSVSFSPNCHSSVVNLIASSIVALKPASRSLLPSIPIFNNLASRTQPLL